MQTESQKRRAAQAAEARERQQGGYRSELPQHSKPAPPAQTETDEQVRVAILKDSL